MRSASLALVLVAALLAGGAAAAPWGFAVAHARSPSEAAVVAATPDAPGAGVSFGVARLATGVELHYAEQGDPAGETVILLHGFTDSWFSFSRVLPLLPRTLHVFAPDQRGHGRSDKPMTGYAIEDFARDVIAFMDAEGLDHATLVGHSMGTFVARRAASLAPERVSRLVLVGTGEGLAHLPELAAFRATLREVTDPIAPNLVRDFQAGTAVRPLPPDFLDGVVRESLRVPARVWQQAFDGMFTMPAGPELGTTSAPTLLVSGSADPIFPVGELGEVARWFPSATVLVYDGTGHAPHWEEPARFARDLAAFLEGRPHSP